MIKAIIGVVGFLYLYPKIKGCLLFLFNLVYGPRRDLAAIYGKGSYALVTGGSEGIGEAVARGLALKGFNLILISRSAEKLKLAKQRILSLVPHCKIIVVPFDFSEVHKDSNHDLAKVFGLDLNATDISIIVNNVGVYTPKGFYDCAEEDIKRLLNVNCVSQVLVTRFFLPFLLKRKSRSAVVNMSSSIVLHPYPNADAYGASKQFNFHFSEALGSFYSNVDVYTVTPWLVKTQMIGEYADQIDAVSTESFQLGFMNNFGSYRYVFCGHWIHDLRWALLSFLPNAAAAFAARRYAKQ